MVEGHGLWKAATEAANSAAARSADLPASLLHLPLLCNDPCRLDGTIHVPSFPTSPSLLLFSDQYLNMLKSFPA